MRIGGAAGPRNGALVTINKLDDGDRKRKGAKDIQPFRQAYVGKANVDLLEVNKVVSSKIAINSVQLQQSNISKRQRNSLITPTGSNNNNNNKTYSTIKTHSLIDEIRHRKIKENPQKTTTTTTTTIKTVKSTSTITTTTPTITTTSKSKSTRPTTKTATKTSTNRRKSTRRGLGMLSSFIVTGFGAITAEIMRILHVRQSLKVARSPSVIGNSAAMHCQQRSAVSIVGCLGTLALLLLLLPCGVVHGDDGDNFFAVNSFSMGPDTTTPEFDYASRGKKKFGDKCDNTLECSFPGSVCDPKKKSCQCTEDLPVTNHIDKCGKESAVNESCFFNEQCESKYFQTECRDGRCVCRFEMTPIWGKDGSVECKGRQEKRGPETYVDPAMIGVLVGMALMFIIICVVLRLFSQARWRENRTIFNTPNPRLMNVSLLRESKLIHGQERRGSRMSMRGPSRQPSMASLRPHSPNPSLGSHSNSHGSGSNASATSIRSNSVAPGNITGHHERHGSTHHQHQHQHQTHQQHYQPHHQHHNQDEHHNLLHSTNITTNPVAESVTVEIMTPDK